MLPRPGEELVAVVDDASAVPPKRRTEALPTQVVECAPMHAQQHGGFGYREEGIVELIAHGHLLRLDEPGSRVSSELGSDSDGPPANESHLSQEVAIPAPRERQPAAQMMTHTSLQSCSPVALDVLDTMQHDGDFVIARACCPAIERHERVAQFARRRRPPWCGGQSRRGRQNAAQRCEMLGRLTNCADTTHEKSDGHRAGCNVRAVNHQLECGSVATQHHVLAPTGVNENMLKAWESCEKDPLIVNA
jgi:hypothetical protein